MCVLELNPQIVRLGQFEFELGTRQDPSRPTLVTSHVHQHLKAGRINRHVKPLGQTDHVEVRQELFDRQALRDRVSSELELTLATPFLVLDFNDCHDAILGHVIFNQAVV